MPRIENQSVDAKLLVILAEQLDRLAGEFRALADDYEELAERASKKRLSEIAPAGLRGAEKALTQLRSYRRECGNEIGKAQDELNERLR